MRNQFATLLAGLAAAAGLLLAASPGADAYPRQDVADVRASCLNAGGSFGVLPTTNSEAKRYSCLTQHPAGWYDKNWYGSDGRHTFSCYRFSGEPWTCYPV